MREFNLTKKNKILLFIAIVLLLITLGFYYDNSMHKSVQIGKSSTGDSTIIIKDIDTLLNQSDTQAQKKPLFVSKSPKDKTKEISSLLVIFLIFALLIYAIASKDNFKN